MELHEEENDENVLNSSWYTTKQEISCDDLLSKNIRLTDNYDATKISNKEQQQQQRQQHDKSSKARRKKEKRRIKDQ